MVEEALIKFGLYHRCISNPLEFRAYITFIESSVEMEEE